MCPSVQIQCNIALTNVGLSAKGMRHYESQIGADRDDKTPPVLRLWGCFVTFLLCVVIYQLLQFFDPLPQPLDLGT